ncbi:MAG: hypothetical protein H7Z40_08135 [Phycisphaerae bacterium]|nr:hypothetical protein [Gemmatimonadaceae bacterium]
MLVEERATRLGINAISHAPRGTTAARQAAVQALLAVTLLLLPAADAVAQELRGTVSRADRMAPAGGVVVVMLHATRDDSIVARTVTNERGRFSHRSPALMPTRVRLLRVGFQPMDLGQFTLAAGETRDTTFDPFDVPIAYATVNLGGNNTRVADRDGRINLSLAPRDTLRMDARKMGYAPFSGKVARDSANGAYRVTLKPNIQNLKTVTVNDRLTLSPLERTGFYDRLRESQRGAVVGEFFAPEAIEDRPASQISQFLRASRYLQMSRGEWSTIVRGRGACPAAIVLDGFRVRKMIYDNSTRDTERAQRAEGLMDINELVTMSQVNAIEVYPSANLAPAAISSQVDPREGMCGIVAIWTGGRARK